MVKIIFELPEELIKENACEENLKTKVSKEDSAGSLLKNLFDILGFRQLKKQVEKGKTEFVVTPDKLDEKSMHIYEGELGTICMLGAFSETDKEE